MTEYGAEEHLLAIARHKPNVLIDLSGWSPKYIPAEVRQYMNSVIPDQFLFGSDFPWLKPDRWLAEFELLELKDEVRQKVLIDNADEACDLDEHLPWLKRRDPELRVVVAGLTLAWA